MCDKHYTGKRPGFSMIVAIFIIVLVAWLASQVLNVASQEAKGTGDRYLRYQAELLADSATDYAVMRIGDYNETVSNNCLEDIQITVNDTSGSPMFNVTSTIHYSYKDAAPGGCNAKNILAQLTGLEPMVLIDTVVTTADGLATEPIRVHHRSWQKP